LLLAAEARSLGHGGITRVARASGISRATIHQAFHEKDVPDSERVRRPGGGRKKAKDIDPDLIVALETLISPDTRGDPMSALRWTCKSTRQLATALKQMGHIVSEHVVRDLLHELGYSLQANSKTFEGKQHPDRDGQFHYLNDHVLGFLEHKYPVVSVDAKKKEIIGLFKNSGQEWLPVGQPEVVNVHDFPDPKMGKAIPYGIYDIALNSGWVSVGQDHDTASFAAATLLRWWEIVGKETYPKATRILICADGGGSNGYRVRLWKVELQNFANKTGLKVTMCHLPPGTSKWNKIEHRLFSHITLNWRGRPLTSHQVVVDLIGATTTWQGLTVRSEIDKGVYPTSVKISDAQMSSVSLAPHAFHGEWNYTIMPNSDSNM
jgi:hypothetical protein